MEENTKESISEIKLSEWGLLGKIRREKIIDDCMIREPYPSELERSSILSEWMKANEIEDEKKLIEWCKKRGLISLDLKNIVLRQWRWEHWCKKNFQDKISSYYLERKPFLDQVNYSILRVKNKNLAKELFLRINEGESTFDEIASNFSEGAERNTFGQIGPVPISQPHPKLAKLLQISKPGQIWSPKELEGWWIIVRLNEIINVELDEKIALKLALELGNKKIENDLNNS